jgi:hypothetical protein
MINFADESVSRVDRTRYTASQQSNGYFGVYDLELQGFVARDCSAITDALLIAARFNEAQPRQ